MHVLRRIASDRHAQIQFITYAAIGGFVQVVDIGLFRDAARGAHGSRARGDRRGRDRDGGALRLNKYVNFRNHDRPVYRQAGTYLAVGFVWWIVTLTIIASLTRAFGVPPLYAKLVAVAVNFPVGYLAHRYLTFGKGITATYRTWRDQRRLKAD